jgi:small nuclear ribonucleoprotein (snRNP)-like protein
MLFFSFFKTLVGKEVAVELKNEIVLTGILVSVDQYLNIKLSNVSVVDSNKYPQLVHLEFSIFLVLIMVSRFRSKVVLSEDRL